MITGIEPELDGWLLGFIPVTPATVVFMAAESLGIVVLITWIHSIFDKRKESRP